jgi:hypothetical protein
VVAYHHPPFYKQNKHMNIIHLVCTGLLLLVVIYAFRKGSELGFVLSFVLFGVNLMLSIVAGFGDAKIEYETAKGFQTKSDIIVLSENFPTQIVTDVKYLDRMLQVKKTTHRNSWGFDSYTNYEVVIYDPKNK